LNQACHGRLLQQAKKLHALAQSLEAWRASEYAKLVRFCDKGTLTRVAEVWAREEEWEEEKRELNTIAYPHVIP
jgi:hypothetical protein